MAGGGGGGGGGTSNTEPCIHCLDFFSATEEPLAIASEPRVPVSGAGALEGGRSEPWQQACSQPC